MNTNAKGCLALHKVCADLIQKGHQPFLPSGEMQSPCDMVVITCAGQVWRLQIKHSANGLVPAHRKTTIPSKYTAADFDFYGIYLPSIDQVIYPSVSFGGKTIVSTPPETHGNFWWYKDFLEFTSAANPRTRRDLELDMDFSRRIRPNARKVQRPSADKLQHELLTMPTVHVAKMYRVSDNAISRWAKEYGLVKTTRGAWTKKIAD